MSKYIIFKNIKFLNISSNNISKLFEENGLFVFPAAPALCELDNNINYYNSLKSSNYVFFDSGYFVFLLKFLKNINVNKLSGYYFIKNYLNYANQSNKKILLIEPTQKSKKINIEFFSKKFSCISCHFYIAPIYKEIIDPQLISLINDLKPDTIIINLGGGVQEILGKYLIDELNFKTRIFCTGAAIAFMNGEQAPVNHIFDKLFLGWFVRVIANPKIFLKRYFKAIKLYSLVKKNNISTSN